MWQYKILNSGFWRSLTLTLSPYSTEITLLLVNLVIQEYGYKVALKYGVNNNEEARQKVKLI